MVIVHPDVALIGPAFVTTGVACNGSEIKLCDLDSIFNSPPAIDTPVKDKSKSSGFAFIHELILGGIFDVPPKGLGA